jgi:hypothetical protein
MPARRRDLTHSAIGFTMPSRVIRSCRVSGKGGDGRGQRITLTSTLMGAARSQIGGRSGGLPTGALVRWEGTRCIARVLRPRTRGAFVGSALVIGLVSSFPGVGSAHETQAAAIPLALDGVWERAILATE